MAVSTLIHLFDHHFILWLIHACHYKSLNRNINFRELQFIASDPSLVFIVEDFNPDLFEEVLRDLTRIVCTGKYMQLL